MRLLGPTLKEQTANSLQWSRSHSIQGDHAFDGWSIEAFGYLSELDRTTFYPTRFACCGTMVQMGIHDQVGDLARMHLEGLGNMSHATYPEPTKHPCGNIEFMVGPKKYTISFYKFCEVYGV